MAAQEEYYHAQIRHAIGLRNLSNGTSKELLKVLDKANAELEAKLQASLKQGTTLKSQRWKLLQKDIIEMRTAVWRTLGKSNKAELLKLGKAEQQFAKKMLEAHIPVQLDFAVASAQHISALITETPFAGGANSARSLDQWWKSLRAADGNRIIEALQLGMTQGETVPQMVARVRAGVHMTRANAEAVIRTGVNHATNQAREAFYKENADIITEEMWSAMLDGRTTAVCRGRDGHFTSTTGENMAQVTEPHLSPPLARPPAHPQCRSQMIASMNALGIAAKMPARPFVRDTRTRRWREKDFRADAKQAAGAKKWKGWSVKQRNNAIKRQRQAWTKQAVGVAPKGLIYDKWLRKQPTVYQNQVLGIAKGKAFRKGLRLDQFTDKRGAELTLGQLEAAFPSYVGG